MNSRIFIGSLTHVRRQAQALAFDYTLPMLWLDLDELDVLPQMTRWFGHNTRRRAFTIHDRDHLTAGHRSIREKLQSLLSERGIASNGERVMLLTTARYFNYTFNPVSFYFGIEPDGALRYCVAEVNNTFGEKHLYALGDAHRLATESGYRYRHGKDFHVSPFLDLSGYYDFAFTVQPDHLAVSIRLIKQDKSAFEARLSGHFRPLTTTPLRTLIWRYPLTGWMTMTRIVTQAARLKAKGNRFFDRPVPASADTIGRRAVTDRTPVSARWILRALERIERGHLRVRLSNGNTQSFGDQAQTPLDVTFHEWRAFRSLITQGDIGLGETYMRGDWTTPDLTGFIRLLLDNKQAVDDVEDGAWLRRVLNRFLGWYRRNSVRGSRRNIAAHYDLSNDLFALFLDPSMTYSSAYFEHPNQSLEEAQNAKYRRLCEQVGLKDGDHVLEIGCGWGGFACFAAQYADCRITALTISQEQFDYAQARVQAAGLADRVEIRLQDYRAVAGEQFDRIVSIEMFEAVGYDYYPAYFKAIDRLLKPYGRFAMQTITFPDQEFSHYRRTFDWIRKYIFPGGLLPSLEVILQTTTRHSSLVLQQADNIGIHYAETLKQWRERFNEQIEAVRALGFDLRFERMWNFYLSYCEAAFATGYLGDMQLVFARPQAQPGQ